MTTALTRQPYNKMSEKIPEQLHCNMNFRVFCKSFVQLRNITKYFPHTFANIVGPSKNNTCVEIALINVSRCRQQRIVLERSNNVTLRNSHTLSMQQNRGGHSK